MDEQRFTDEQLPVVAEVFDVIEIASKGALLEARYELIKMLHSYPILTVDMVLGLLAGMLQNIATGRQCEPADVLRDWRKNAAS